MGPEDALEPTRTETPSAIAAAPPAAVSEIVGDGKPEIDLEDHSLYFQRELVPALAEHGIRFIDVEGAGDDEKRQMAKLFEGRIFPALTPLVIGLGRPFPYISNLSLSLAVVLRDPDQGTEVLARVKV